MGQIFKNISIHAPHEGERPSSTQPTARTPSFQSTLPTRGSDEKGERHETHLHHFNPRSPRGGATAHMMP